MKVGQTPESTAALASGHPQKAGKNASPAAATAAAATSAAAPSPVKQAAAGVPVTVSAAASAFSRSIDATGSSQGDFNADRVRAVKAAIENGTYKVDAEAIADKLLSNAQEILSRPPVSR